MKNLLAVAALTLLSVSALADIPNMPRPRPPRVEPGPIQSIEKKAVGAMDALLSVKATDMKKFISAGNMITASTVQNLSPDKVSYTFTRQNCTMGGIVGNQCLGGSQLQVVVETVRKGSGITKTVTSTVNLIR
jgi:hypothetical protein